MDYMIRYMDALEHCIMHVQHNYFSWLFVAFRGVIVGDGFSSRPAVIAERFRKPERMISLTKMITNQRKQSNRDVKLRVFIKLTKERQTAQVYFCFA